MEDLATAVYFAGVAGAATIEAGDKAIVTLGSPESRGALSRGRRRACARSRRRCSGWRSARWAGRRRCLVIGEREVGAEHDGVSTGGAIALWIDEARESFDEGARILVAHEVSTACSAARSAWGMRGTRPRGSPRGWRRTTRVACCWTGGNRAGGVPRGISSTRTESDPPKGTRGIEERLNRPKGRGTRRCSTRHSGRDRKGKRSLDDVIRALAVEARKAGDAPLSVEAFRAVVERETGPDEEKVLSGRGLMAKWDRELPDGAFGPCFFPADDGEDGGGAGFDT